MHEMGESMTCIIALESGGKVYMGGDSSSVSHDWMKVQPVLNPKVFQVGEMLIGYTSSFRMGQLLQYHLDLPARLSNEDDMTWLVTRFIPAVRECFRQHGFLWVSSEREAGGEFLIGYRGKIFRVDSDFQVSQPRESFASIGCGEQYALAAMAAYEETNQYEPVDRIEAALSIAEHFSPGVVGPYTIIRQG
jgi:ATP-dependent protease HslVU (ClpYQ) peptidase subunit